MRLLINMISGKTFEFEVGEKSTRELLEDLFGTAVNNITNWNCDGKITSICSQHIESVEIFN